MDDRDERIWAARLRWRLRGAWQGPTFVVLTLVGAVLLNRLPISGDDGLDPIGAFLLCGFFNLAVIAAAAPVVTKLVLHRRPSPVPETVMRDRIATGLMSVLALVLLAIGVGHHASVTAAQEDYDKQLAAVRQYLAHQAPPEYRAAIGLENVWKQKDGFYRTCVPGLDPRRNLCLYVRTDAGLPTVKVDPDMQPNARIAGADNPGRQGG